MIGETCADVTADVLSEEAAEEAVARARREIEAKIASDPFFGETYSPYEPSEGDGDVVRRMCEASRSAGVGPMAAVAGAVARCVAEAMLALGAAHVVVDNGGDVAVSTGRRVAVGVGTGDGGVPPFAILIGPTDGVVGVCSSSARVGHSVSLGASDVCTVVAEGPELADACATALGNMVLSAADLGPAAEAVCAVPGVIGCVAVAGGSVSVCGDVEIVPLRDS